MKWKSAVTAMVVAVAAGYSGVLVYPSVVPSRPLHPVVSSPPGGPTGFLPGDHAPDFTLKTTGGSDISLDALLGGRGGVWLNFWATWCPHCREELALIDREHQHWRDRVAIVGVDLEENPSRVKSFAQRHGVSYPVALDTSGRVAADYGVRALPTSVFIGPHGTIRAVYAGAVTAPSLARYYLNKIAAPVRG